LFGILPSMSLYMSYYLIDWLVYDQPSSSSATCDVLS
jgi:hypothetical protein